MLNNINSGTIILLLLSISVLLVGYLNEAKAYSSVSEPCSGLSYLICPSGEKHQAAIAFEATSTPSTVTGDWDIVAPSITGDVFKSGVISGGEISSTGNFVLTGKEIRDDICGSLASESSIQIKIIGQCATFPSGGPTTTLNFRATNGETAVFLPLQQVLNRNQIK